MKTSIKILGMAALVLCVLCSFTTAPGTINSMPGGAYLTIAGKFGGDISKKEILSHKELGVDGCAVGSRIFTYQIELSKGGKISSFKAESNVLSKEIIAALKDLNTGDSFEFKKIKAYLPNGKDVVDVHSKKFVIVADQV
jgi:hypothetical protein